MWCPSPRRGSQSIDLKPNQGLLVVDFDGNKLYIWKRSVQTNRQRLARKYWLHTFIHLQTRSTSRFWSQKQLLHMTKMIEYPSGNQTWQLQIALHCPLMINGSFSQWHIHLLCLIFEHQWLIIYGGFLQWGTPKSSRSSDHGSVFEIQGGSGYHHL